MCGQGTIDVAEGCALLCAPRAVETSRLVDSAMAKNRRPLPIWRKSAWLISISQKPDRGNDHGSYRQDRDC